MASLTAWLSLDVTSAGRPAGPTMPCQVPESKPGATVSASVGTSGRAETRLPVVTARALTLPSRT
ncbi:hypothetical protein D3C72_1718590 [compost metagenome]